MKTPRPKRGWHLAKKGEYHTGKNTAWYLGNKWFYNLNWSGRHFIKQWSFPSAIKNHPN